jgi:hypothetical protein
MLAALKAILPSLDVTSHGMRMRDLLRAIIARAETK